MAEVEMGEVDDMHSKDEATIVNGDDLSDPHEKEDEEESGATTKVVDEAMEVQDSDEDDDDDEEEEEAKDNEDDDGDDNEEEEEEEDGEAEAEEGEDNGDVSEVKSAGETVNGESKKDETQKCTEVISESVEIDEDDDKDDDNSDSSSENAENVENDMEIVDDASQTSSGKTGSEPIELNDSNVEDDDEDDEEEDVMIVDSTPKENGEKMEVIDLETPEKPIKQNAEVTPRRSSRNLNKSKSFVAEIQAAQSSEESDIEEVVPSDPLAVGDSISIERVPAEKSTSRKSSTIVVKDTKKLVEIAAKSNNNSGKKEPTLVIIDTNSLLSGRGGNNKASSSPYSQLPVALPAQGMYPANMRATITPIPPTKSSTNSSASTPLLPTLTDDMFVVEAPSFIVPYVYEKPPVKDFKEFILEYKKIVEKELKEREEEEKKRAKDEDDEEEEEEEDDEEEEKAREESKKKRGKDKDDKDYNIDEEKDVDSEEENAKVIKKNDPNRLPSYFDSPLGKFFVDIGFNLVQEYVQSDLLRQQKRKREREGGQNKETDKTIHSLIKNLEFSKENNAPFKFQMKRCEFCNYKTESALAMGYHLEAPHMKNFVYRCSYCSYEIYSPNDILFHMEAEHGVRGHLERAAAFHQCSNCPFEDNQKGKLSRHLVACMKKFKPNQNLDPPVDWEPPAKIPRVPKMRQGLNATAAAYQAMAKTSQFQIQSQQQQIRDAYSRGRGRPPTVTNAKTAPMLRPPGVMFNKQMSGGSVLLPANYQLNQNQPKKSSQHQPSISITPLPRSGGGSAAANVPSIAAGVKPGDNSKNSFVICEICDGYIKDLEQLRNHMQWIHKIKIHPKMIYNRPPLNCQKCQFRFFTDQGLERHLLGSHGLVTSSMQDAANKSKDSGRCPVCGRVYQWKLLNHVARDHNMTLKPAHLSYKCTVCTATFGMYKQFENHVYSAHSVVAKRTMDKKMNSSSSSSASSSSSSAPSAVAAAAAAAAKDNMKPLKINDEITIIPQPPKSVVPANGKEGGAGSSKSR